MFKTSIDVEIGKSHLKEFFGQQSDRVLIDVSQHLKEIYPQVQVKFGNFTRIEGLTGVHMTDEYGDISEDIDKILNQMAGPTKIPSSFCEYSSDKI